jgi:hypothetical protein
MTGTEVALIITASGAFVTSAGGVFISILNRRLSVANAHKIEEVHLATNSMKDELVALTRKDARAEGRAEGDEAGHTRGVAEGDKAGHKRGIQDGVELASTIQP